MVKELIHDPILLAKKSRAAGAEDLDTARDLLDTLSAHKDSCVGMAANMIGVYKNIIVFDWDGSYMIMLNPVILKGWEEYRTREGCLSLQGDHRPALRYRKIKVQYENLQLQTRIHTFTGFTAQIIQHEIDHCNGILI